MGVAAVIPHWNRAQLLQELLESMRGQTRQFEQVIVADNGSTDGSVEIARGFGATVIELGSNVGFAAAVNRGIQAARGEWVAILNNDVTLAPDWLEKVVTAAEASGAWFAAGKILSARDARIIDGTFDEISRGGCAWRCGAGKPDSAMWNQARAVRFVPMTAAVFRRELFAEIGLLDEAFGSYLEDVDFGLRCALAGRSGWYEPDAVARHRGSATLGAWNSDTVRRIARNQVLLIRKHFLGQPRIPIVVGQLLWGILALRHCKVIAYIDGKLSGLRFSRQIGVNQVASSEQVAAIVEASEANILTLGRQAGMDWYWRAYFWLLRR